MAITDQNTVLILGAGVSVPFGLPLGGRIMENIGSNLEKEFNEISKLASADFNHSSFKSLLSAATTSNFYDRIPIHGALARKHLSDDNKSFHADLNEDLEKLKQLRVLLDEQTSKQLTTLL